MATSTSRRNRPSVRKVASAAQLLGAAEHTITLVTGTVVRVRMPDVIAMIAGGSIPNELRNLATVAAVDGVAAAFGTQTSNGDEPATAELREERIREAMAPEKLNQIYDLYAHVVSGMLLEPVLSPEQVRRIDPRDFDLLSDIAWRRRNTDALGVRLGVVPLSEWATFREKHGCGPDCEGCHEVVMAFSSRSDGDV